MKQTGSDELIRLIRRQLELIGEDPERDGLKHTPARVAEALHDAQVVIDVEKARQ